MKNLSLDIELGAFRGAVHSGEDFKEALQYIEALRRTALKNVGMSYPADHVFDENKTVKWNRDQVIAANHGKDAARSIVHKTCNELLKQFDTYVKQYCELYLQKQNLPDALISDLLCMLDEKFMLDWPKMLDSYLDVVALFLNTFSQDQ